MVNSRFHEIMQLRLGRYRLADKVLPPGLKPMNGCSVDSNGLLWRNVWSVLAKYNNYLNID